MTHCSVDDRNARLPRHRTVVVESENGQRYRTIQSLFDALFPKGRDRCYWKSLYLRSLDNDAIDAVRDEDERRSGGKHRRAMDRELDNLNREKE